jgi:glycosyltransferase involved in cell wall biosynthesis
MATFLFIAANEGNSWGGSELLWSRAAEKLVYRGHEVRVSAKDWNKPIPGIENLRKHGCKILPRRFPPFLSRMRRKFFKTRSYQESHVSSAGAGAELVIISQGVNLDGLQWIEPVRAAGYPYVVISQGAHEMSWPEDTFAEHLAIAHEAAKRTYFVSEANLELSRREFATPLKNGRVIRNPFNVSYQAKPEWPPEGGAELSLACIARLEVMTKGHDVLFGALALPHWRERSARVSLFGEGPNERTLRRMAADLKLTNVEFQGPVSDIEEIWRTHHALVLASRYEGMPLVVVEAMLCGRACVVTDVGGNRELVRDGLNGFIAKAATVELMDEALNRVWEKRSLLRDIGRKAATDVREWVSEDPSEDFARELLSLLEAKA